MKQVKDKLRETLVVEITAWIIIISLLYYLIKIVA